jgi:putative transcriptional regulator
MAEEFCSLKGQMLLDSGQLRGSFFHRAVVLVCQHDAQGAFGLVLTRPTENKVGEALVAELPETLLDDVIYLGGPVQNTALTFLHADSFLPEPNILPNLRMGHSLDELREIGESFSATRKIRCFAGYAGWTGGQLEEEMKRKAWLVHPATIPLVFSADPTHLWKQILIEKDWEHRLLAESPEDLSWN